MNTYQPGSGDAPVPMNFAQMAAENERVLIERGPMARSWFPPPWLRAWPEFAVLVGTVCAALGTVVALAGWHGEQIAADVTGPAAWVAWGTWIGGCGIALAVVGIVACLLRRR